MYDDVKIYWLMIIDPNFLEQQKSYSSCLVGHAVGFVFDIVHENVTVSQLTNFSEVGVEVAVLAGISTALSPISLFPMTFHDFSCLPRDIP